MCGSNLLVSLWIHMLAAQHWDPRRCAFSSLEPLPTWFVQVVVLHPVIHSLLLRNIKWEWHG